MLINKTKYPAQRITVFAVYHKFNIFGSPARSFKVAFPDRADAEKWVESHGCESTDKYMIEEFSGIMKAWKL